MSADNDGRVQIAELLSGLRMHPLEPGATPLEAFIVVKSLDQDGHVGWSFRTTAALNLEELLGALITQSDLLRKKLVDQWEE